MAYFNMMRSFNTLKNSFIVNRITTIPPPTYWLTASCMNNNPNVFRRFAVTSRYAFGTRMENPFFIDVKVTRQKKGV